MTCVRPLIPKENNELNLYYDNLPQEVKDTAAYDADAGGKNQIKRNNSFRMLWMAFQLAFRVYNFAGGQDDRAARLSREVAHEIETDAQ